MRLKYYEDPSENAAFERCVDLMTDMILKYGPELKRKWLRDELLKNISMDFIWDGITLRRFTRYCKLFNPKSSSEIGNVKT